MIGLRSALLVVALVVLYSPCWATDHYVRDGGTCVSSCQDWTNAFDQLSSAETAAARGDKIYVADGTYTSTTFNTAVSGTTLITICKATVATVGSCGTAHGTETGWLDSYGDGQAIFSSTSASMTFSSNYWVLDGVVGDGSTSSNGGNSATYGFLLQQTFSSGVSYDGITTNGSNSTFKHIAVVCAGEQDDTSGENAFDGSGNSLTFSYTFTKDCTIAHRQQGTDHTVEYSWMDVHWGTPAHHDVQLMSNTRPIYRYNYFVTCGSQCIEPAGGCTSNMINGQIYGNVIAEITGTNGFTKGVCSAAIIDTVFYNNTMANSAGPLLYQSNNGTGSGNIVKNNLIYNSPSGCCTTTGGGAIDNQYNAYFDSGTKSETGVQNGSGNPFVSSATGNFRLLSATNAGVTLSTPYNVDLVGVTRGNDGSWDRGAYEFCVSGCGSSGSNPTGGVKMSPMLNLRRGN